MSDDRYTGPERRRPEPPPRSVRSYVVQLVAIGILVLLALQVLPIIARILEPG